MKTIVQNLAIEYQDEGSGPVMLMLHGWKDSLRTFDAIATKFVDTHRVVRLDMPGFGQSEMPKNTWGVQEYALFVRDFIQKMNLDIDVLMGHSFGGRVIIKGVGIGQLGARKIVLISAAGLARRKTARNRALGVTAKLGRALAAIPPFRFWRERIRRSLYTAIGSDYFSAGALKDTFVKVVSEDLSEYAKKITTPALIVWGTNDSTTPLEQAERTKSYIAGSTLKVVDQAGHFVHKEQPERVTELIKEFI